MSIKLLLAMRNEVFGKVFSDFITTRIDAQVVGICRSENEVKSLYKALKPDLLLIDVKFGVLSYSFDLISDILAENPQAKIVGVTAYLQKDIEETLFKIGAKGYMKRNDNIETMLAIIRRVNDGKTAFGTIPVNDR